jgi:hypothetical protein
MKKRQNYNGRRFVWLDEVKYKDYYEHEHDLVRTYFAFRSFTYQECKSMIINVIRLRPNHLTKNGKDYSNIEAGHRFKTLFNAGVIKELV